MRPVALTHPIRDDPIHHPVPGASQTERTSAVPPSCSYSRRARETTRFVAVFLS